MKIAHIGLASFFTENMTYQDNQLSAQNAADGHQVLYVSNASKYVDGRIEYTGYEDKLLSNGMRLVRMPYERMGTNFTSDKFRKVKGLYELLEAFAPDVILSHDLCYWSVRDVIRYKKNHPEVKLYADSHTDSNNSGSNWLSLHVLHRIFYRRLIQKALPYLEKYLGLSTETIDFNIKNYGVPKSLTEFYPLGGTLFSEEIYEENRRRRRAELALAKTDMLFVHSGKMDALKRTEDLLRAFSAVENAACKLVIIGSIPEDMKEVLLPLIAQDGRIAYLGWKNAEELMQYLCACDLYCQPGGQSATMQNAVCCNCAMMLYPHQSHTESYDYGNILWVRSQADMEQTFRAIATGDVDVGGLKENSSRCARELLDYKKLAARLYR